MVVSRLLYGIEYVEIFSASDASVSWKAPATREPTVSQATLTVLAASLFAVLAHSLGELSAMCKGVRGVEVLLILSKTTQTFGQRVDDELVCKTDGLNTSEKHISKRSKEDYINLCDDF